MENVLLSPHVAGATDEAQEAIGIQLAHQVRDYLKLGVVQNAVNEANRKIVTDNNLKLALEPQVEFPSDQQEVEKALDAKADFAFKVAVEVMPSFELADLSDVSLTKLVASPSDEPSIAKPPGAAGVPASQRAGTPRFSPESSGRR